MNHTLDQKLDSLPDARRKRIQQRADTLISEELTLRDLRRALGCTQAMLAQRLNIGQETVSRYERRTDMLLSTLRSYLRAMGGELELVVRFNDRPAVRIQSLEDVAES